MMFESNPFFEIVQIAMAGRGGLHKSFDDFSQGLVLIHVEATTAN
jgi:hypothetical protein